MKWGKESSIIKLSTNLLVSHKDLEAFITIGKWEGFVYSDPLPQQKGKATYNKETWDFFFFFFNFSFCIGV